MDNNSFFNLVNAMTTYYRFIADIEEDTSEHWKRKAGLVKHLPPPDINRMMEKIIYQRLKVFLIEETPIIEPEEEEISIEEDDNEENYEDN